MQNIKPQDSMTFDLTGAFKATMQKAARRGRADAW